MQIQKIKKLLKFSLAATFAIVIGAFVSVRPGTYTSTQSILLDFDTEKAVADTPDSGSGSGSGDSGTGSGDSGSGSGDCGGDCGGDSG